MPFLFCENIKCKNNALNTLHVQGYCWLENERGHFTKNHYCLSTYIIKLAHYFKKKGPF